MRFKRKTQLFVTAVGSMLFISVISPTLGFPAFSISISSIGTISYPSSEVSWLHTSGIYIYNDAGQRINLYAVNIPYGMGDGISATDIEKIKALGFNTFRFNVYWSLIQPINETIEGINELYFMTTNPPLNCSVDDVVNWAVQDNMYCIICLCWTLTWAPPLWAFPKITDDLQRYDSLINGTASRERLGIENTWKYIANRYKNSPNVLFELLNEPGVSDGSLAGSAYALFNEEIVSAMESVETSSHLKLIQFLTGPPTYEEILDSSGYIDKPNVLWATHVYYPLYDPQYTNYWDPNGSYFHDSFTWNGQYFPAGWGNGTVYLAWRIIRCVAEIHNWNQPLIPTEFGKFVTQPYWQEWINTVLSIETENNAVGWALWCYCHNPNNEVGWNINDPSIQPQMSAAIQSFMLQP